jgi:hypothetical protein
MSRRKPEEVPYIELTKAKERYIENIDRHPIPANTIEFEGYTDIVEVEMKYRGSKYKALNYLNNEGESVGVALVNGSKTIYTNLDKIQKNNDKHYNDLLLAAKLQYEKKITF